MALIPLLVMSGVLALALLPGRAQAAAGAWARADMVEARLLSAVDGAGDSATLPLGLHIRLKPGWKSYWRAPGDAGLPPQLDWAGSRNLQSAELSWPAPVRFTLFGLQTFGYEREVVLPLTARRIESRAGLDLRLGLDLLVCHELCVPAHLDLALAVPAGPATPSAEGVLIAEHAKRVPGDGAAAGLSVTAVRDAGDGVGGVDIEATARAPFLTPDLFLESDPPLAFGPPTLAVSADGARLTARLVPAPTGTGEPVRSLAGRRLTVTLVDGERAMETTAPVLPAATAPGPASGRLPVLLAALLGGLILNLMPCVLPVLSLKLLAVVGHGGGSRRAVRAGFLASAAGILAAFLALAVTMIALKAGGAAVGWGIQFQQPAFLAAMVVVVGLFAGNLWGLFEIPLPGIIARAAERPEQAGLLGPFLTGVFATLLATPCSAPFLGTAVGFALARGPADILAVFALLGLGLALPYLAVAALPGLATALPRPGRWMIGLRRVLGATLAGTGLWLLWVLAGQGTALALAVLAAVAGLVAALALRPRLPAPTQRLAGVAAVMLAAAAVAAPSLLDRPRAAADRGPGAIEAGWQRFELAAVREQVAAGKVVLVDVTADWCLTCQANKRFVLDRPEITERLQDTARPIVAMQADWTRPDAAITAYLASFGRYGVPFNVVYGPGAPDGLPLPELLSVSVVLDGLRRAGAAGGGGSGG